MQEKICFTQKELARRWTLSHRTLERWRWDDTGPAYMKFVAGLCTGSKTSSHMRKNGFT